MDNDLINEIDKITNTDDVLFAVKLFDKITEKYKFTPLITLGCVYKYGKIQGIKEEKEKLEKA